MANGDEYPACKEAGKLPWFSAVGALPEKERSFRQVFAGYILVCCFTNAIQIGTIKNTLQQNVYNHSAAAYFCILQVFADVPFSLYGQCLVRCQWIGWWWNIVSGIIYIWRCLYDSWYCFKNCIISKYILSVVTERLGCWWILMNVIRGEIDPEGDVYHVKSEGRCRVSILHVFTVIGKINHSL